MGPLGIELATMRGQNYSNLKIWIGLQLGSTWLHEGAPVSSVGFVSTHAKKLKKKETQKTGDFKDRETNWKVTDSHQITSGSCFVCED